MLRKYYLCPWRWVEGCGGRGNSWCKDPKVGKTLMCFSNGQRGLWSWICRETHRPNSSGRALEAPANHPVDKISGTMMISAQKSKWIRMCQDSLMNSQPDRVSGGATLSPCVSVSSSNLQMLERKTLPFWVLLAGLRIKLT